jgi:D-alanyl-D-alanine carboxypeptidase
VAGVRSPDDADWVQASGFADVASGTASTLAGHYSIRSVTKSLTVTLILELVRDQVLSLDDKLAKFVPGIPNGDIITIADLAGMQSGIFDYSKSQAFADAFGDDPARAFTEEELVAFAIPQSPVFAPGEQYDYSNTNTVLLGMIVEKLTGLPLAQAMSLRIVAPLGLGETTYPYTVALPDPHPTPYEVDYKSHALEVFPFINPTSLAGAGAMVSTLDDMLVWARALGTGSLVGAQLHQQRMDRSRPATNGPLYDRYGLGIGLRKGWWGHTGFGVGFTAAAFYDPRTQTSIAVLVNSTPSREAPAELTYAQAIFEALAEVVATR